MSVIKEEKKKKGKQSLYVNDTVKNCDDLAPGSSNLFGEIVEDRIDEKFDKLLQLGNLHINRTKFSNPQGTRVYSPKGCCPTLTVALSPKFLIKDGDEYKTRDLTGFESMRLMGVEDEDIQKLVDGGLSNSQLCQLAGNSIVVDCMSAMFKEMIKH